MKSNPLVSIITPSFNQGQFIEHTIKSVLAQSYKNIQYIIVDGGSSDQTMDIVRTYRDRVNIVIHEKDRGQSDAINKGFRLAEGELVGWINSDDVLYPDCVEKLLDTYRTNGDGAIYYSPVCDIIDKTGHKLRQDEKDIPSRKKLLRNRYEVIQPGSFYRTDYVRRIGYLDEDIHYCMDLDLWLRLLELGPIYKITGSPVACYREWEETKSSIGGKYFYRNIRGVLQRHGAYFFDRSVLKTWQYEYTGIIKNLILRNR